MWITEPGAAAVSVGGDTTSGRVSRGLGKVVSSNAIVRRYPSA
jgi:hypothetical protein